jgi:hypothetical protein
MCIFSLHGEVLSVNEVLQGKNMFKFVRTPVLSRRIYARRTVLYGMLIAATFVTLICAADAGNRPGLTPPKIGLE